MFIKNHLLYLSEGKQAAFIPTPNKGSICSPQYLVMHYTAATKAAGSINWFKNPAAKASAHLVIDRDGTITQFAPFNVVTWHAGVSQWNGISGLNGCSIGIELVNGGRLTKVSKGFICSTDQCSVATADAIFAKHKNDAEAT